MVTTREKIRDSAFRHLLRQVGEAPIKLLAGMSNLRNDKPSYGEDNFTLFYNPTPPYMEISNPSHNMQIIFNPEHMDSLLDYHIVEAVPHPVDLCVRLTIKGIDFYAWLIKEGKIEIEEV